MLLGGYAISPQLLGMARPALPGHRTADQPEDFTWSKSQRKCLRRNEDLTVHRRSIHITPAHEALFARHAQRFSHNRPMSIYGFFSFFSSIMPCLGMQFDTTAERPVAGHQLFSRGSPERGRQLLHLRTGGRRAQSGHLHDVEGN